MNTPTTAGWNLRRFSCLLFLAIKLALPGLPSLAQAQSSPDESAQALYVRAIRAYRSTGDAGAAVDGLREAHQADESFAPALFELAVLLLMTDQWDEAAQSFHKFIALEPASERSIVARHELERIDALRLLSNEPVRFRQMKYEAVLAELRDAGRRGALDELSQWVAASEELDGSRWEALAAGGGFMMQAARFTQACPWLERAAQRSQPDHRDSLASEARRCAAERDHLEHIEKGLAAYEANDATSSANRLWSAFQLFPSRLEHGFVMVSSLTRANRYGEALEVLEVIKRQGTLDHITTTILDQRIREMKGIYDAIAANVLVPDEPGFDNSSDELLRKLDDADRAATAEYQVARNEAIARERAISSLEFEMSGALRDADDIMRDLEYRRRNNPTEDCQPTSTAEVLICAAAHAAFERGIENLEDEARRARQKAHRLQDRIEAIRTGREKP